MIHAPLEAESNANFPLPSLVAEYPIQGSAALTMRTEALTSGRMLTLSYTDPTTRACGSALWPRTGDERQAINISVAHESLNP